jgi:RNA polymerase sigma factor (TIGR02999 family)
MPGDDVPVGPQARLLEQVYDELRRIARARLAQERPGHTLQATALVHEAYLKLHQHPTILHTPDKSRFFATAAEIMRQILIDHARSKGRQKRGGPSNSKTFADVTELATEADSDEILALDEALYRLGQLDAQAAQVVKLRFFAGLSIEETAETLGISDRTVKRDWQFARAWLYREMRAG